jgi:hypothetical protein
MIPPQLDEGVIYALQDSPPHTRVRPSPQKERVGLHPLVVRLHSGARFQRIVLWNLFTVPDGLFLTQFVADGRWPRSTATCMHV